MAVTFFERQPDNMTIVGEGRDRRYVFQFFEPGKGDLIGAYKVAVYSPHGHRKRWEAVKFRRVAADNHEVITERELTVHEIALFEQRVRDYYQAKAH